MLLSLWKQVSCKLSVEIPGIEDLMSIRLSSCEHISLTTLDS